MVKGISRRVVVVESPDQRYFEQAIFIVRNDAAGEGVTARELVEEAQRVARDYAGGDHGRFSRVWRDLSPAVYTLMGAAWYRPGVAGGGTGVKKSGSARLPLFVFAWTVPGSGTLSLCKISVFRPGSAK